MRRLNGERGVANRWWIGVLAVVALLVVSCGSDSAEAGDEAAQVGDDTAQASDDAAQTDDDTAQLEGTERPVVVVTTNILGDVVENLVGDQFDVITIMPVGTDPHDFQPSAAQVAQIGDADVLIANGAAFEEGLLDVIEAVEADGVPVYEAIEPIAVLDYDGHDGHDEHGDEHGDDEHGDEHGDDEHGDEHGDDEHGDEHGDDEHGDDEHSDHAHEGGDPHFFTDPARMATAAEGIVDFLVDNVEGVDADALRASAAAYISELQAADAEVEQILSSVPEERRVLVTNHEVFGYFAERYDFEVVGAVVPGGTTTDGVSAAAIVELAELIESEGVPAIFADTSSSDELVQTLAGEVGEIGVVQLYSESLGDEDSDGATYLDMVRTNAQRIADALT